MPAAARDVLRNHVKDKLARNEIVASMTVRLVRGIEIARIARTAGFDTFYVDIEHCSFSLDTTSQLCLAGLAAGITPMVRVPNGNPEYVARVLEGGALGVIVPHVRSAAEAKRVVAAAKFAPEGDRSLGGTLPHLQYRSFPAVEAMQAVNNGPGRAGRCDEAMEPSVDQRWEALLGKSRDIARTGQPLRHRDANDAELALLVKRHEGGKPGHRDRDVTCQHRHGGGGLLPVHDILQRDAGFGGKHLHQQMRGGGNAVGSVAD